jgi:hypothetical protein
MPQPGFPFGRNFSDVIKDIPFNPAGGWNGLIDWLGDQGSTAFRLPESWRFKVVTSQSSNLDGTRTADKAFTQGNDASVNSTHTNDVAGSWWKVDFKSDRRIILYGMAILGRSTAGAHLRNWTLEGSDDDSIWYYLGSEAGGPNDNAWYTAYFGSTRPFRYLRITQTGVNSSGTNYLTLGDVEFYGKYLAV